MVTIIMTTGTESLNSSSCFAIKTNYSYSIDDFFSFLNQVAHVKKYNKYSRAEYFPMLTIIYIRGKKRL